MIARVVTKRDDLRLAMTASFTAVGALLSILVDDIWGKFRPGGNAAYVFVAVMMALGAIAPWLTWARRGRSLQVRCADGAVQAGSLRIATADTVAVSIARGARGHSVAVTQGKENKTRVMFFEVERAEDAAKITETLGVSPTPLDAGRPRTASRVMAVPQAMLSLTALACAQLYYIAATKGLSVGGLSAATDVKALFGIGGVVATVLAFLVLLVRAYVPGHGVALKRGAWDAHLSLHRGDTRHDDLAAAQKAAGLRAVLLERGDENIGAWLARLDALPTDQHAYRSDAMKKDVLWETLGDHHATVDARMGAARVLRRRYGEENGALVRVVDDPDVRVRVEAALEEHDEAERHLESLGPLFRTR